MIRQAMAVGLVLALVPACRDQGRAPAPTASSSVPSAEPGGGAKTAQSDPPKGTSKSRSGSRVPADVSYCGRLGRPETSAGSVRVLASFEGQSEQIASLWLWGDRLAYVVGGRQVAVCDLQTGTLDGIARANESGRIDAVRASGDVVVWTEFDSSGSASGPPGGSPWSLYAHNVETRETIRLATGEPVGRFFSAPEPEIDWPFVTWTDLPQSRDAQEVERKGPEVVVVDLRTKARRVVASGTFPGAPTVWNGHVYFDAIAGDGRDLYVVPADGSASPKRLTSTGDVGEPAARNGWVAWDRLPRRTASNEAIGDVAIVALDATTEKSREVARGNGSEPGSGFVVHFSIETGALHVAPAASTSPRVVLAESGVSFAPSWSADGKRIAYATVADPLGKRSPVRVHIAELR